MIFLTNVKITNQRIWSLYRGSLKIHDRMDVFKYALASWAQLEPLVSKFVFYIDLATSEYAGQETALADYIHSLFPEGKLILNFYRNNTQKDWQNTCNNILSKIDDNVILNVTNDDHIFLDSSIDVMMRAEKIISEHPDFRTQFAFSHWPECMRGSNLNNSTDGIFSYISSGRLIESLDMQRKERWFSYWFTVDLGNYEDYYRPEQIHHRTSLYSEGNLIYLPLKEQFRHYDGYGHVAYNDPNNPMDVHNLAPALIIPPGFFEKKIRIAYGYDVYRQDWVNINPANPQLKISFESGTDYKFSLEDIPMFWRSNISEIDINPGANLENLREFRDEHMYKTANTLFPHQPHKFCEPRVFRKFYLSEKYKAYK